MPEFSEPLRADSQSLISTSPEFTDTFNQTKPKKLPNKQLESSKTKKSSSHKGQIQGEVVSLQQNEVSKSKSNNQQQREIQNELGKTMTLKPRPPNHQSTARPASHSQTTATLTTTGSTATTNPLAYQMLTKSAKNQLVQVTTTSSSELDLDRERQQRKMVARSSPKRSASHRQVASSSSPVPVTNQTLTKPTTTATSYNPKMREQMLAHKNRDVLDRSITTNTSTPTTSESSPNQDEDEIDDEDMDATQIELTNYPRQSGVGSGSGGAMPIHHHRGIGGGTLPSSSSHRLANNRGAKPMSSSPNSMLQPRSYPVARAYEGSDSGEDLETLNPHHHHNHPYHRHNNQSQVVYENLRPVYVDEEFSTAARVRNTETSRRMRNTAPVEVNDEAVRVSEKTRSSHHRREKREMTGVGEKHHHHRNRDRGSRSVDVVVGNPNEIPIDYGYANDAMSSKNKNKSASKSSSLRIDPK